MMKNQKKPIKEKDDVIDTGPTKEKELGSTGNNVKVKPIKSDKDILPEGPTKDSKVAGDTAGRFNADDDEDADEVDTTNMNKLTDKDISPDKLPELAVKDSVDDERDLEMDEKRKAFEDSSKNQQKAMKAAQNKGPTADELRNKMKNKPLLNEHQNLPPLAKLPLPDKVEDSKQKAPIKEIINQVNLIHIVST